jgi:hypothetical protein
VVTEPEVIVELWEQLLAQERELPEWESTLLAREHSVVEGEHALGRARMEYDAIHDQITSVRGDYLSPLRAFTTGLRCSLKFD